MTSLRSLPQAAEISAQVGSPASSILDYCPKFKPHGQLSSQRLSSSYLYLLHHWLPANFSKCPLEPPFHSQQISPSHRKYQLHCWPYLNHLLSAHSARPCIPLPEASHSPVCLIKSLPLSYIPASSNATPFSFLNCPTFGHTPSFTKDFGI